MNARKPIVMNQWVLSLAMIVVWTSIAPAEDVAALSKKRQMDIEAVHRSGRRAFTDLQEYPGDRKIPRALLGFPFRVPFPGGSWVRCQQANNTMDHENDHGASHGPDKSLRYSLDLNFDSRDEGQTVVAAAPGKAYAFGGARPIETYEDAISEKARDNGGLGNFVAIDHGNGFASIYAHLKEIKIKNGTSIASGEPLGSMGKTGGSGFASPHLHFYVVPVLKVPEPDPKLATRHEEFNILYNATFGWSVPFLFSAVQAHRANAVMDSRLIVSDYYRVNPSSDRQETDYWFTRPAAPRK